MERKYLKDIGIDQLPSGISSEDPRREYWIKETEEYGFPSYETWALDFYFYCWLYERLKKYLEVTCVDLNYHKFKFNDNEYTQKELIDKMLYGCELCLLSECKDKHLTEEEEKVVEDVPWIWATVMPAMWW